jgi:hypothetical protein
MQRSPETKSNGYDITGPIKDFFNNSFAKLSSETLGWIAILCLHGSTIPSLLALMAGVTDNVPPVDLVLMVWTALTLFFIKAAVQKDLLNLITIGLGFLVQAAMMILIFFK